MAQQQSSNARAGRSGAAEAGTSEKAKGKAHEAKDKASELAHEAKDKASELAHEAQQKASAAADRAGEKASELADRAEHAAESALADRKHDVAQSIHVVADALRLGAERIRERGDGASTGHVTRIADRVDEVSGYLERHDVREMAREVETFARRHTGAFLGGAFALGVLGARFVKSSGERATSTVPRSRAIEHRPPSHEELGTAQPTGYGGTHA